MDCMRVNSPLKRLSLLQISRIHMGAFWRWHRDLQILSACYKTLKLLGKEISWKENHNSCHIYLQLCFYPITQNEVSDTNMTPCHCCKHSSVIALSVEFYTKMLLDAVFLWLWKNDKLFSTIRLGCWHQLIFSLYMYSYVVIVRWNKRWPSDVELHFCMNFCPFSPSSADSDQFIEVGNFIR